MRKYLSFTSSGYRNATVPFSFSILKINSQNSSTFVFLFKFISSKMRYRNSRHSSSKFFHICRFIVKFEFCNYDFFNHLQHFLNLEKFLNFFCRFTKITTTVHGHMCLFILFIFRNVLL